MENQIYALVFAMIEIVSLTSFLEVNYKIF